MPSKNGRSSFSVVLSIGLMHIPLKLYSTSKEEKISFKMISPDGNPVKQKLFDSVTDEEVQRDELKKGYPDGDSLAIFTKEEIDSLDSHKSNVIDVQEFVPLSSINHLEIEKSFQMNPDSKMRSDKAFKALNLILTKKKRAGVAKWYSRGRESLVVIAPHGKGLVLHQMFYSTEVKYFELDCANVDVNKAELELFGELIDSQSVPAYGDMNKNPGLYRDCYIDRVHDVLNAKRIGTPVDKALSKPKQIGGDLASVLQASVKAKPKTRKKKAS